MKLVAKSEFEYAGRALTTGDEFDASDKDAKILVAIGRAGKSVGNPHEVEPQRKRRGRPPGRYKRRDMRPED